ncbi:MAG: carbohydrate ABC transporter permease [Acidobacteriaceae bacterium]|nr:carbohydrate ABC transporter permease [Acidobacteriaceae bacterium]
MTAAVKNETHPRGPKPNRLTASRAGVYAFAVVSCLFFLMPLYIMVVTSFKTQDEIRRSQIFALPHDFTVEPWIEAWSNACTGVTCDGLKVGFANSIAITVPAVILSILAGALLGYSLSLWRTKGSNLLFGLLLAGAFLPYQIFIYPLVRVYAYVSLYGTLFNIITVHVIFGLPVMTLLFRNYFSSVPIELFRAARVDGAGFWRIFVSIMLPLSTPMVIVAVILQVTGIWNDFLLGTVFAGQSNWPMTVQLNNIVNTTQGTRAYNVDMAATILTAAVPLVVYFISGRWFVRGIAAGAVKG